MPPACSLRDSATKRNVNTTTSTPIGRLTKKIASQPIRSVRMPPANGPIATAAPVVAPQMPNAVPRSLPRYVLASSASEQANIRPAPTPCSPRARLSISGEPARPHSNEANVNSTTPIT